MYAFLPAPQDAWWGREQSDWGASPTTQSLQKSSKMSYTSSVPMERKSGLGISTGGAEVDLDKVLVTGVRLVQRHHRRC